jgi:uncharacterized membrane protein YgcG
MLSSSIASNIYANVVTKRLTKANHVTWKAQVMVVLQGARLVGHVTRVVQAPPQEIDGKEGSKVLNLAYEEWYAIDQQVLGFLLSSLSKNIAPQVATKLTRADAWKEVENMFSSRMRARTINTRLQLATTQKGSMTVAEYMNKMRSLGDEMAAVGRKLEDDELVEYILTAIVPKYDPIILAVIARESSVSINELYAQLLTFETRLTLMNAQEGGGSLANLEYHGCDHSSRGSFGRNGGGRDGSARGGHGGYSCGSGCGGFNCGGHDTGSDKHPISHVCKKRGHMADRCWHRFEEDYVLNERTTAAASGPQGDTNWCTDSGAIDHITSDLEKPAIHDKYTGNDQIHIASGSGMNINHIGYNIIHTPCHQLQLNKILHVPQV